MAIVVQLMECSAVIQPPHILIRGLFDMSSVIGVIPSHDASLGHNDEANS